MLQKNIKVIFDTNVWISFLIGKRLSNIKQYLDNGRIIIITTNQLLNEIKLVTSRDKLKHYFPKELVDELIELLETIAINVKIKSIYNISRDPKDNFLLDLIDYSKADFLVTGDKDLLVHNPFKSSKIVTPAIFEKYLEELMDENK